MIAFLRLARSVVLEIVALFVDDGVYACAIVAWVVLVAALAPRLQLPSMYEGLLLTLGLMGILILAVRHAAHRSIMRDS